MIKGSVVVYENKALRGNIETGTEQGILKLLMKTTAYAKVLSPVNKQKGVGGRLRNSIMWKMKRAEGNFNDSPGVKHNQKINVEPNSNYDGFIGSNLEYAIYQEFGTRKMAPQPYLRPAIARVVLGKGKQEVKDTLEKEMERGKLVMGQVRESFF